MQKTYFERRRQLNRLLLRAAVKTPFRWDTLDMWRNTPRRRFRGTTRAVGLMSARWSSGCWCGCWTRPEAVDLPHELEEVDELAEEVLTDSSLILVELRLRSATTQRPLECDRRAQERRTGCSSTERPLVTQLMQPLGQAPGHFLSSVL